MAPLEKAEWQSKTDHTHAKCDTPRQECTKAAQRPDQCKGSNAGDAGSVLGLAFLPTTFDANQEADSRRQAGALKEFDVHDDLFIAVRAKNQKTPSAQIGQWQSKPSGLVLGLQEWTSSA